MLLEFHIPKFPLNAFIESFTYFEGIQHPHSIDRFLPNGDVEILVDFDDEPQFIFDNETLNKVQACRHVWASGVRTEPITIPSGTNARMMVISFKKGMAYPFFPFPMNEISNCVLDSDLVWGVDFKLLRERLLETRNLKSRFEAIENFLLETFHGRLVPNACVSSAVGEMIRRPNQMTVGRINSRVGYSQKHFIDMFKRQVGVTPKSFLKIMRFQLAIAEIGASGEIDWASVANDCGYFDQSHFINDFKRFSGFTPEAYFQRRNGYPNYVPVG